MAEHSQIEWTDATWNPITGCSIVSPGCTNCYAMRLAGGRLQHHSSRAGLTQPSKAGPVWTGDVRFNHDQLGWPLQWRRPRRIFVCAHGDLFAEQVPVDWIDQVFAVMALAPQHTFQVLTKRAYRMRAYVEELRESGRWLTWQHPRFGGDIFDPFGATFERVFLSGSIWLGVSAEDQVRAEDRIPHLLETPAAVRFLSAEPLLGELDLTGLCTGWYFVDALGGRKYHDAPEGVASATTPLPRLDWVIVGGESGTHARPIQAAWARSLRQQCAAHETPFFFKQWGEFVPTSDANGPYMMRVGKTEAGRLLDGVEHNGVPNTAEGRAAAPDAAERAAHGGQYGRTG